MEWVPPNRFDYKFLLLEEKQSLNSNSAQVQALLALQDL